MISVWTIWWCPLLESFIVLLEKYICYDQCVLLTNVLAFALLHFVLHFVAYWTASNLGGLSSSVISFCLFILFNGVLIARILEQFAISLPGTKFCQNSPLWPVHLGWPCMASFRVHWVMQAPLPWQGCDPWMGWEYCLWAIIKHFSLINKGMSYLLFFWTWLCHHGMPLWWTSCQHKNI